MMKNVMTTLIALAVVNVGVTAMAAPVAWYRMEGTGVITGTDTVANAITGGGAAPDATHTGADFNYASTVVAPFIYDPISDTTVSNSTSFAFTGGTAAGTVRVAYNDPGEAVFDVADFTIEMFVRVDTVVSSGAVLASHGSGIPAPNTGGWLLRSVLSGGDDDPAGVIQNGSVTNSNGPTIDDGAWHHLAFVVKTSDDGSNFANLYMDSTLLFSKTTGLDNYVADVNASFFINAMGYTGFFDEVRFSNSVLAPSQFLQATAVPEPATLALLGLGGLMMGFRGRRNV